MLKTNALETLVVDRAGFALPNEINSLSLANGVFQLADCCGVPSDLANLFGPMRDWRLSTGLAHNAKDARHAAIEAVVLAHIEGRPRLTIIGDE